MAPLASRRRSPGPPGALPTLSSRLEHEGRSQRSGHRSQAVWGRLR